MFATEASVGIQLTLIQTLCGAVMNKSTLGVIFLIIAAVNIYWAAEIARLRRQKGSPEELTKLRDRANRLARFSRISYFLVGSVLLMFIIFGGYK